MFLTFEVPGNFNESFCDFELYLHQIYSFYFRSTYTKILIYKLAVISDIATRKDFQIATNCICSSAQACSFDANDSAPYQRILEFPRVDLGVSNLR